MTRRLVFLTPGYSDPGGVARRSRALAAGLADRDWRVLVIARAPHLWHPRLSRRRQLWVVEVPGFGVDRLGSLLFLAFALPVGVVMGLRGATFLAIKLMSSSSTAALSGMLSRRPFISMATSSGADSEALFLQGDGGQAGRRTRTSGPRAAALRLRRCLLRRAAFVVAQTAYAADGLSQLIDRERIVVIPNPVKVVDLPAPMPGGRRAVFTGRLTRQKDPLTLVRAWQTVVATHPDACLTIVGDGGRHEPLEREVRQVVAGDVALQASVRFTGWVPDVTPHLAAADVFVLPSLFEGMSNSLLEACASGRLVVASDIPANRAVLGDDYPLLFPPGDADALASRVLQAFDDETLRSDVKARVEASVRDFTLDSVVDRLEQVILMAESVQARPRC